jgi:hypothetical protein
VKFWEYVGFVGALLVVFGVLLELQDIWHRYGEEMTTWALSYFGASRSLEKPRFFKKFGMEVASVILVAGGVACELGAGFMIESKNTALRAIDIQLRSKNAALRSASEQLLALVTQQAGNASDSAQKARDAAQRAWEYAAWRTISNEQAKVIRTFIGSSLSGHTLTVQANPDEAEIWTFANDIATTFGMKATATLWPHGWLVPAGLKFSIGKNRQKDFDLMVKALDMAGVDKEARLKKQSDHKGASDDDLILTVGPRH